MNKKVELLPAFKNYYSFNLGLTSYIYPADIISNILLLKDSVDEIELVLFEGEYSNLPSKKEIEMIHTIGKRFDIKYNVHFPINTPLITNNEYQRKKSLKTIEKIYNLTLALQPLSYTLHIEPFNKSIFKQTYYKNLKDLKNIFDFSVPICIENLNYNIDDVYEKFLPEGFSSCIDIGHLILYNQDIKIHLKKYIQYTKIIHFHGVEERDHKSIKNISCDIIRAIINECNKNKISLILEVFNFKDAKNSLLKLGECSK